MSTNRHKKRPSNDDLKRRREYGINIIKNNNYVISLTNFKKDYTQTLHNNGYESITRNKINRDIDKILLEIKKEHPKFEFTNKQLRSKKTPESITPLKFFEKDITEIRLVMNSESNIIIFNTEKKQLENSTFTKKAIRAIPKSLSNDTLIKLCIYFSPMAYRGIETVVCDIYERLLDIPNNIISTHARHRCAEIEVKKADISKVLDFTYSIFNHYWISQAKRRKNNLST